MKFASIAAAIVVLAVPGSFGLAGGPSGGSDTVLYDFRADWCGPCRSMDPVVEQFIAQGYPVKRVNVDQNRELSGRYGVQGIPCFVMVVDGKEVDRIVGATDHSRLEAMFSRNGVGPGVNSARGQSPGGLPMAGGVPFPSVNDSQGLDRRKPSLSRDQSMPILRPSYERESIAQTVPAQTDSKNDSLIRASVRLKIEDQTGNSVGSGTIIDARSGEALIITCGHVFRDAVKNGHILVDLFGPNAPQQVPAKLIDYDLKSEVGLISIETNYPVAVAKVAPTGFELHRGDAVVSVGCDSGAAATAKSTQVTSINRYVGAPNVEVGFQPVPGRSGGGLFTPDGQVVGVCYAADPEATEGLFASLPALCAELDKAGLSFVYRSGASGALSTINAKSDANELRPAAAVTATPAKSLPSSVDQLSPEEQATLALLRDNSVPGGAICIVKSKAGAKASSEFIVLDQVSPDFAKQLAAQQSSQPKQLTSLETNGAAQYQQWAGSDLQPTIRQTR